MELKYKGQFLRDIDIRNQTVLQEVAKAIINVKSAKEVTKISNLKKLKKYKTHYRIKIAGDYRIGIIIRDKTVWFTCFGHRSNFYKQFP